MTSREQSMADHPAGKALISPEVLQEQLDDQACALGSSNWHHVNEWHHDMSTRKWSRVVDALTPFLMVLFLFGLVFGSSMAADLGWWLA